LFDGNENWRKVVTSRLTGMEKAQIERIGKAEQNLQDTRTVTGIDEFILSG